MLLPPSNNITAPPWRRQVSDRDNSAAQSRLRRFEKKAPRGVLLYLKRPATLVLGKDIFSSGEQRTPPPKQSKHRLRGENPLKEPENAAAAVSSAAAAAAALLAREGPLSVCVDVASAPWVGSPPRSDPMRRAEDPEVGLLAAAPGAMVPAYDTAAEPALSPLGISLGAAFLRRSPEPPNPWAFSEPPPPPPMGPLRLPGSPGHQRVWISLTTLPGRIDQIHRTVETLLNQTVPADEVHGLTRRWA